MISEKTIEKVAMNLEHSSFEGEMQNLKDAYPVIHAYLLNDQLEHLSEEEYQLLLFGALVILHSFEQEKEIGPEILPSQLEDMESANWAAFDNSKPTGFREKLDSFFNDTEEEELLAFIEDLVADDEEMPISSAAKEVIFISLKSLVDVVGQL